MSSQTKSGRIDLIELTAPVRYNDGLAMQRACAAEIEKSGEKIAKLLFLQHSPVYTLGRATSREHLLCSEETLAAKTGAEVLRADRGGSVTYHAPGQLTAYMLLNLQVWELGIQTHLSMLEECAIKAICEFGLKGRRQEGMTGVWVGAPEPAKICAIGVSARRWITYHGLGLNVNIDLKPFYEVVPCGLRHGVTSMAAALQREVCFADVEAALASAFGQTYGAEVRRAPN